MDKINLLRSSPRQQRGVTMLMVLVILAVMLLGGLAMARVTEVGAMAVGNSTYRETSLHASEVGLNTAFENVNALTSESAAVGNWYSPTMISADAKGIPNINWSKPADASVGVYEVRYVVERMCDDTSNSYQHCLLREQLDPDPSGKPNPDPLDPPQVRQFKVTVKVTGPKDTEIWVQSLITKSSSTPPAP